MLVMGIMVSNLLLFIIILWAEAVRVLQNF